MIIVHHFFGDFPYVELPEGKNPFLTAIRSHHSWVNPRTNLHSPAMVHPSSSGICIQHYTTTNDDYEKLLNISGISDKIHPSFRLWLNTWIHMLINKVLHLLNHTQNTEGTAGSIWILWRLVQSYFWYTGLWLYRLTCEMWWIYSSILR